jgi:hypothetical protein
MVKVWSKPSPEMSWTVWAKSHTIIARYLNKLATAITSNLSGLRDARPELEQ